MLHSVVHQLGDHQDPAVRQLLQSPGGQRGANQPPRDTCALGLTRKRFAVSGMPRGASSSHGHRGLMGCLASGARRVPDTKRSGPPVSFRPPHHLPERSDLTSVKDKPTADREEMSRPHVSQPTGNFPTPCSTQTELLATVGEWRRTRASSAHGRAGAHPGRVGRAVNTHLRSHGHEGTVSDRTVRNWLTGKTRWPHPRQREALEAVFGCTAEELGFGPPAGEYSPPTSPEDPVRRRNFLAATTGTTAATSSPSSPPGTPPSAPPM